MRYLLSILALIGFGVRSVQSFLSSSESRDLDAARYDQVVVIPDIHGDFNAFVKSLYLAFVKVTEVQMSFADFMFQFGLRLSGSTSFVPMCAKFRVLLVQLGDVADRGPDTRMIMQAIHRLDGILGWDVVSLMGNHELSGRFGTSEAMVHRDDSASFGGALARRASYSPGGEMWAMMNERYSLVARVGTTLFAHAGIDPSWFDAYFPTDMRDASVNIDTLNAFARQALWQDEVAQVLFDPRSPLMTRAYVTMDPLQLCTYVWPRVKVMFKVKRIVVGHSAGPHVRTRCGGEIILADFAMSKWMRMSEAGNAGFVHFAVEDGQLRTQTVKVVPCTAFITMKPALPTTTRAPVAAVGCRAAPCETRKPHRASNGPTVVGEKGKRRLPSEGSVAAGGTHKPTRAPDPRPATHEKGKAPMVDSIGCLPGFRWFRSCLI